MNPFWPVTIATVYHSPGSQQVNFYVDPARSISFEIDWFVRAQTRSIAMPFPISITVTYNDLRELIQGAAGESLPVATAARRWKSFSSAVWRRSLRAQSFLSLAQIEIDPAPKVYQIHEKVVETFQMSRFGVFAVGQACR